MPNTGHFYDDQESAEKNMKKHYKLRRERQSWAKKKHREMKEEKEKDTGDKGKPEV
jgi:hypothetical protein